MIESNVPKLYIPEAPWDILCEIAIISYHFVSKKYSIENMLLWLKCTSPKSETRASHAS